MAQGNFQAPSGGVVRESVPAGNTDFPSDMPTRCWGTLGKFVGRHRLALSAAALTLAVVMGMAVFCTIRLRRARNAAQAEAARTERIQQFMPDLFAGGDAEAGPADDLRVVSLLDRDVQEARALNSDPAVQAELYETLGGLYQKLGKLEKADTLRRAFFTRMAAIYRKVYGDRHYLLGIALSNLGGVHMDRKQYTRAERLFRQAIALFTETLSPNHLNTGIARIKLGCALVAERRFAEAETESLAGYEILVKQTSHSVSWLQNARADRVTECEALH